MGVCVDIVDMLWCYVYECMMFVFVSDFEEVVEIVDWIVWFDCVMFDCLFFIFFIVGVYL